jgi:ribonucleoside-diphosphate reductase alpha chain
VENNLLDQKSTEYLSDINNLTVDEHLNVLKTLAKYIDQSISKTFNIPNNYSFENFKNLYLKLFKDGIKGGTTYRAGTIMSVVSDASENPERQRNILTKTHAPKRPKRLKCDIHHTTAKGQEWVVIVGLINGSSEQLMPYEVFAFKKKSINLSSKISTGFMTRIKSGHYNLETEYITLENITELFEQDEEEALTRMISISMRHGVDIKFIVEQLNKSEGTIASFSKAIIRSLKKYVLDGEEAKERCPECNEKLLYLEGCIRCSNCSYNKC